MMCLVTFLAPLALVTAPSPEPERPEQLLRLTGGLGVISETRRWADDQAMLVLALTPTLHFGDVVFALDAQHRTTGHNDEKLDLGARVGGAWDMAGDWDGTLTLDGGWRRQTKSRFVADTFLGSFDDQGIDRTFAYAGVSLAFHDRPSDGSGFVWGVELFGRADLARPFEVTDEDGSTVTFGGTFELGVALELGWDAPLRH